MTEKPNCSKCTIKREVILDGEIDYAKYRPYPYSTSYFRCLIDDRIVEEDEYIQICKRGCLSHPDAQAYLMADVIKELEKLTQLGEIDGDEHNNYISGIYEAISLIKNGVKND